MQYLGYRTHRRADQSYHVARQGLLVDVKPRVVLRPHGLPMSSRPPLTSCDFSHSLVVEGSVQVGHPQLIHISKLYLDIGTHTHRGIHHRIWHLQVAVMEREVLLQELHESLEVTRRLLVVRSTAELLAVRAVLRHLESEEVLLDDALCLLLDFLTKLR